ncbi:hypothetical protein V8G54_008329 [Vigna mungo]|uniref:Uncharacterized protein n=1 Tax=Vigna mungo TaxID=3915 RepID=A0AAQ3P5I6_VIGMU
MGLQHTLDGWLFKNEVAEEDEEAGQSSYIPYRARSEFKRISLREIRSLKIMCQGTNNDVTEMKKYLIIQNRKAEEDDEEDSGQEGSTPVESATTEEEESEDDDVAEYSNSDMLLRPYLKKNKKKI